MNNGDEKCKKKKLYTYEIFEFFLMYFHQVMKDFFREEFDKLH